jgi:AcrR family transcriptional regulator
LGGAATRDGKTLLSREDWSRSALDAIAEGGVLAVTIEGLAKRLHATRGSFYWHFQARDELIEAALELWARESTTDRLPELEAIADPVKRLRVLLRSVYETPGDAAEVMLSTAGDDPLIAPVFARVTRRRMDVLRRIFTELGMAPSEVADRAWLAYAFYIGHHQLRKNPEIATRQPARIDRMVALLTGGRSR